MNKTEGFEILLNGIPRSSRDQESVAYDAANLLKKRWPQEVVTIRRPDGSVVTMQVDGRQSGSGANGDSTPGRC